MNRCDCQQKCHKGKEMWQSLELFPAGRDSEWLETNNCSLMVPFNTVDKAVYTSDSCLFTISLFVRLWWALSWVNVYLRLIWPLRGAFSLMS